MPEKYITRHVMKVIHVHHEQDRDKNSTTYVFSNFPATEKQKIECARVATMIVSPTPRM
jgi:hypothetical protein